MTPAIRQAERDELAQMMAAFERQNGPIRTQPIRIGDAPAVPFSVTSGAPKKEPRPRNVQLVRAQVRQKLERIEKIKVLIEKGLTNHDIAAEVGISHQHVGRLISENKLRKEAKSGLRKSVAAKNERIKQIAQMLQDDPAITIVEIGNRIGCHPKTASKLITRNGLRGK